MKMCPKWVFLFLFVYLADALPVESDVLIQKPSVVKQKPVAAGVVPPKKSPKQDPDDTVLGSVIEFFAEAADIINPVGDSYDSVRTFLNNASSQIGTVYKYQQEFQQFLAAKSTTVAPAPVSNPEINTPQIQTVNYQTANGATIPLQIIRIPNTGAGTANNNNFQQSFNNLNGIIGPSPVSSGAVSVVHKGSATNEFQNSANTINAPLRSNNNPAFGNPQAQNTNNFIPNTNQQIATNPNDYNNNNINNNNNFVPNRNPQISSNPNNYNNNNFVPNPNSQISSIPNNYNRNNINNNNNFVPNPNPQISSIPNNYNNNDINNNNNVNNNVQNNNNIATSANINANNVPLASTAAVAPLPIVSKVPYTPNRKRVPNNNQPINEYFKNPVLKDYDDYDTNGLGGGKSEPVKQFSATTKASSVDLVETSTAIVESNSEDDDEEEDNSLVAAKKSQDNLLSGKPSVYNQKNSLGNQFKQVAALLLKKSPDGKYIENTISNQDDERDSHLTKGEFSKTHQLFAESTQSPPAGQAPTTFATKLIHYKAPSVINTADIDVASILNGKVTSIDSNKNQISPLPVRKPPPKLTIVSVRRPPPGITQRIGNFETTAATEDEEEEEDEDESTR